MKEGLTVALIIVGAVGVMVLLMKMNSIYIRKGIQKYAEERGIQITVIKTGIPPLRLWLKNRKGDKWGLVQFPDGAQKWARYRTGLFGSNDPWTFFDA